MSIALHVSALGSARKPLADTYLTGQYINAAPNGSNDYVFSDLAIGTPDSRRNVILIFVTNAGTTADHSSVSANAGAVTFTKLLEGQAGTGVNKVTMWGASVPAGTTLVAPTLRCSAAPGRCNMEGYTIGRSLTMLDSLVDATSPLSGQIDQVNGGLILAVATATAANPDCNAVWTGVTEDFDQHGTGGPFLTGGRYTGAAEVNRTIDPGWNGTSFTQRFLLAAAFGAKL